MAQEQKNQKKKIIVVSIFMTHMRRIGVFRTFIGGFLQYLSFAEFVFIHLTTIVVLYKWLLVPFFGLKKFRNKDYIVLDRNKIEGLALFDRINCEFCGYANGIAKLWNDQLDEVARGLGKGKIFRKFFALIYVINLTIMSIINYFFSKVLYRVISLFLGLHWASNKEVRERLRTENYAGGYNAPLRGLLRFAKLYSETLLTNLEQIESQWCPIKHLESKEIVLPDHHKNFIPREKLDELIHVLETDGSVSPRKPKY